uniref:Uncharacterized protein n=1 Tax=Accipiter nisus TaxID=211598 RepID=A0A8B9MXB0_9AVES
GGSQGSAMDRMKKIKRQLSMTLRGGRAPEKSLGEPRDGHGSDSGERARAVPGPLRSWEWALREGGCSLKKRRIGLGGACAFKKLQRCLSL